MAATAAVAGTEGMAAAATAAMVAVATAAMAATAVAVATEVTGVAATAAVAATEGMAAAATAAMAVTAVAATAVAAATEGMAAAATAVVVAVAMAAEEAALSGQARFQPDRITSVPRWTTSALPAGARHTQNEHVLTCPGLTDGAFRLNGPFRADLGAGSQRSRPYCRHRSLPRPEDWPATCA